MSESHISNRMLPSVASLATNRAASLAASRSAQNTRITALANPNAALLDMQEEISFAISEKMEKKNADNEKAQERNAKRLKELARLVKEKGGIDDKSQEPLQHKIENNFKQLMQRKTERKTEQQHDSAKSDGGAESSEAIAWRNSMALTSDKAAIFQALSTLREKSHAKGDSRAEKLYEVAQARCAKEFEPQIRAAVNIRQEYQEFAKKNNLPAEKVLDAYQKTVADYSGILNAALTLTEKLGLKNSAAAADFIRESASKEIISLQPSVSPEQLLHILAELKGLQVLATVKEQVSQHRETMQLSEQQLGAEKLEKSSSQSSNPAEASNASSAKAQNDVVATSSAISGVATAIANPGITSISHESLVTALLQSALKPQVFPQRIDEKEKKAYGGKIKELVLHMQGLHKIFKSIPEYAFPDRFGKQKALMPVESRIDSLIAREREQLIS